MPPKYLLAQPDRVLYRSTEEKHRQRWRHAKRLAEAEDPAEAIRVAHAPVHHVPAGERNAAALGVELRRPALRGADPAPARGGVKPGTAKVQRRPRVRAPRARGVPHAVRVKRARPHVTVAVVEVRESLGEVEGPVRGEELHLAKRPHHRPREGKRRREEVGVVDPKVRRVEA
eukprot:CAMPEP_0172611692 /NCGR_PEP_ID=MMETSP1068-20121228/31353_1 /TAXON_ID=35684 /ORGANISM="Pseudopedinella elastica, Strain CCMP716" /LENGTH=172 /DNA_ID=CAMNT_0013415743 /DNA_START=207 /DNA_END=722 /DNA_ORIENTATION=-